MKTIVITGTTSGIGYETAKQLVIDGNHVVMCNKDEIKTAEVLKEFKQLGSVDSVKLDLCSFKSTLNCAKAIKKKYKTIDVLINNAGVFSEKKKITEEGFEKSFQVNYLSQKLFTDELMDRTEKILMVCSKAGLYGKVKTQKGFFESGKGFKAYSGSKLAQIIYGLHLMRHGHNVIMIHPGDVATNIWEGKTIQMKLFKKFSKTVHQTPREGAMNVIEAVELNPLLFRQQLYNNKKNIDISKLINQVFNQEFIGFTENVIKSKKEEL